MPKVIPNNIDVKFEIGKKINKEIIIALKKYNNHIFYSNYIPTNIRKFNRKKKYLYFCGIGNPEEFEYTLKKYNFKIVVKF